MLCMKKFLGDLKKYLQIALNTGKYHDSKLSNVIVLVNTEIVSNYIKADVYFQMLNVADMKQSLLFDVSMILFILRNSPHINQGKKVDSQQKTC